MDQAELTSFKHTFGRHLARPRSNFSFSDARTQQLQFGFRVWVLWSKPEEDDVKQSGLGFLKMSDEVIHPVDE